MMLAAFLASKVGRALLKVAAVAAAVCVILWRVFAAGKAAERQQQDQQSLENLRTRNEVEADVEKRTPDDRRADLGEWVQDDDR